MKHDGHHGPDLKWQQNNRTFIDDGSYHDVILAEREKGMGVYDIHFYREGEEETLYSGEVNLSP